MAERIKEDFCKRCGKLIEDIFAARRVYTPDQQGNYWFCGGECFEAWWKKHEKDYED